MIKKISAALIAAFLLYVPGALAQSSPNWPYKYVPTQAQWNAVFAGKQDTLGYVPLNTNGGVMTGRLVTAPPGAATSNLNLTPGTAPASPADGDMWVTSGGIFIQVNGVTVGPLVGSGGAGSGTVTNVTIQSGTGITVSGTCTIPVSGTCIVTNSGVLSFGGGAGAITVNLAGLTFSGNQLGLTIPVSAPNGGSGVISPAANTIPINQGASPQTNTGVGATGSCVGGNTGAAPTFQSGCRFLLATLTASNSAVLNDSTACGGSNCITTTYAEYELVFENIIPATNGASLTLQIHSGGVYKSTGYLNSTYGNIAGAAPIAATTLLTTAIQLSQNSATDATNNPKNATPGINGMLKFYNPSANQISVVSGALHYLNAGNTSLNSVSVGGIWNTAGVIDGFQAAFNSGNITSGNIKIYAYK